MHGEENDIVWNAKINWFFFSGTLSNCFDLTRVESIVNLVQSLDLYIPSNRYPWAMCYPTHQKPMVEIEVKMTENVMEACAKTPSVRNCVLTSSLLACVWRGHDHDGEPSSVVSHNCWSHESVCLDKKVCPHSTRRWNCCMVTTAPYDLLLPWMFGPIISSGTRWGSWGQRKLHGE